MPTPKTQEVREQVTCIRSYRRHQQKVQHRHVSTEEAAVSWVRSGCSAGWRRNYNKNH